MKTGSISSESKGADARNNGASRCTFAETVRRMTEASFSKKQDVNKEAY